MTKVTTTFNTETPQRVMSRAIPAGTIFTGVIGVRSPSTYIKGDYNHTIIDLASGTVWDSEEGSTNIANYRPLRTVTITGEY